MKKIALLIFMLLFSSYALAEKYTGTIVIKPMGVKLEQISTAKGEVKLSVYAAQPKSRVNVVKIYAKVKLPDYHSWIKLGGISYPFSKGKNISYEYKAKNFKFNMKVLKAGREIEHNGHNGNKAVRLRYTIDYSKKRRVRRAQ